jgi:hypothetical protein
MVSTISSKQLFTSKSCWRQPAPSCPTWRSFTLYVVDHDNEKFRNRQEEFSPVWGGRKPAWTLAPVPALALEGMLVEIDVIAVVPR